MAVTKIKQIKMTLEKAISYVINETKTKDGLLVYGYNVDPNSAAIEFSMTDALAKNILGGYRKKEKSNVLAHHVMQSFSHDDNISPEKAHELGKELADKFLGGKFEYVLGTHIDKEHIHNHIIFNAVSFYDYKKFRTEPFKTVRSLRNISDLICAENELSIVEKTLNKDLSSGEFYAAQKGISWKQKIKARLNFIINLSVSYEDFKDAAQKLGININDEGKHNTFIMINEGQEKCIRGKTLDKETNGYTFSGIKDRIEQNRVNVQIAKEMFLEASVNSKTIKELKHLLAEQGCTLFIKKTGDVSLRLEDKTYINCKMLNIFGEEDLDFIINTKKMPLTKEYDIKEMFENSQNSFKMYSHAIEIENEQIVKKTEDGVLVEVTINGEKGKVFINKEMMKTENEVLIGDTFQLQIETETGNVKKISGEDFKRACTKASEGNEIDIPEEFIKSISIKGMTLSIPQLGVENAFIDKEFVTYDRNKGTCKCKIFDNWVYPALNKEKSKIKIEGVELRKLIEPIKQAEISSLTIQRRILAMQRKLNIANIKKQAKAINTIKNHNIETIEDFEQEESNLKNQIKMMKEKEYDSLLNKISEYKEVAKNLATVSLNYSVYEKYSNIPTGIKKSLFYEQNNIDISAFELATERLDAVGVRSDIPVEKVVNLIKETEKQAKQIKQKIEVLQKEYDMFHIEHLKASNKDR